MDSGFDKIRRGNYTLYIHKDFRNSNLEQALLAGEKELREHYRLTTIQSSEFARVYKFTVSFDGVERRIYFKQYLDRSILDSIKPLFRASRARRAFKASEMLAENGFESPTIIAIGEFKSGFFHTGNFLATIEVEDAKQIYQIIPKSLKDLTRQQLRSKRELIRAIGQTIGRMHAKGIFHGDLRLGNVLARQDKNGWRLFFLDNERTRKFWRIPNRLRLKNLVQINMFRAGISRTDRLRFFEAYLSENPEIKKDEKTWNLKITHGTNHRLKDKNLNGDS